MKDKKMKSIVISGATGFLGSNLVDKFLENGYIVWAIVRPESKNKTLLKRKRANLNIVILSLLDNKGIISAIKKADAWFHFAWGGVNRKEIDSAEVQQKNIDMSLNVLSLAHDLGCEIFFDAGSRVEYGIVEGKMREDARCNPINEYGKAKLKFYKEAALLSEKYNMKYCHLRFFSVYGFGDHPWSIISTLLRELPRGNTVSLSACRHLWNFMYIEDAVEAVYRLFLSIIKKDDFKCEIVNIASDDTRELRAFVEKVYRITGSKGNLEYGTFQQAKEGALSIIPDVQKLHNITCGWKEKYSFEMGIRETLKKEQKTDNEKN